MKTTDPSKPMGSCPICGKPTDAFTKPFCSSRCRNVDLNRWLKGSYAIPAVDDEDSDDAPPIAPVAGDDDER